MDLHELVVRWEQKTAGIEGVSISENAVKVQISIDFSIIDQDAFLLGMALGETPMAERQLLEIKT